MASVTGELNKLLDLYNQNSITGEMMHLTSLAQKTNKFLAAITDKGSWAYNLKGTIPFKADGNLFLIFKILNQLVNHPKKTIQNKKAQLSVDFLNLSLAIFELGYHDHVGWYSKEMMKTALGPVFQSLGPSLIIINTMYKVYKTSLEIDKLNNQKKSLLSRTFITPLTQEVKKNLTGLGLSELDIIKIDNNQTSQIIEALDKKIGVKRDKIKANMAFFTAAMVSLIVFSAVTPPCWVAATVTLCMFFTKTLYKNYYLPRAQIKTLSTEGKISALQKKLKVFTDKKLTEQSEKIETKLDTLDELKRSKQVNNDAMKKYKPNELTLVEKKEFESLQHKQEKLDNKIKKISGRIKTLEMKKKWFKNTIKELKQIDPPPNLRHIVSELETLTQTSSTTRGPFAWWGSKLGKIVYPFKAQKDLSSIFNTDVSRLKTPEEKHTALHDKLVSHASSQIRVIERYEKNMEKTIDTVKNQIWTLENNPAPCWSSRNEQAAELEELKNSIKDLESEQVSVSVIKSKYHDFIEKFSCSNNFSKDQIKDEVQELTQANACKKTIATFNNDSSLEKDLKPFCQQSDLKACLRPVLNPR